MRIPEGFRAALTERERAIEDSLNHAYNSHFPTVAFESKMFSEAWTAGKGIAVIQVYQRTQPVGNPGPYPERNQEKDGLDSEWIMFRSEVLRFKPFTGGKMERLLIKLGIDSAARSGLLRVNREDPRKLFYLAESRGMIIACKEAFSETCGGIAMCYSVPGHSARKMARFLLQADFE